MLKRHFVGRGMRLEFSHPEYKTPIVTSSIQDIRELSTAAPPKNTTQCRLGAEFFPLRTLWLKPS